MVKFLIQSDWGQTHLQTPSPTQSQDTPSPTQATPSPTPPEATPSPTQATPLESQPSSPEQQEDSVQTPQESEEKVEEQEETPEESEQQTQADARTSPQPVTFNKSLAVQQALIAAASMGYTEVMPCWCLTIPCMLLAHIANNCVYVFKIVSYLLDLPERDEEDTQRAQINSFDTLWGETGKASLLHYLSNNCLLKYSELPTKAASLLT